MMNTKSNQVDISVITQEEFETLMCEFLPDTPYAELVQLCILLIGRCGLHYREIQEIPMSQLSSGLIKIESPLTDEEIQLNLPEVKKYIAEHRFPYKPTQQIFLGFNQVHMNKELQKFCGIYYMKRTITLGMLRKYYELNYLKLQIKTKKAKNEEKTNEIYRWA